MPVDWRVYYKDGSTFDSTQGKPDDAPPYNVLMVIQKADGDTRRDELMGAEYYFFERGGGWVGADWPGVVDKLVHRVVFSGFLTSVYQPRDQYEAVIQTAQADPDFPALTTNTLP